MARQNKEFVFRCNAGWPDIVWLFSISFLKITEVDLFFGFHKIARAGSKPGIFKISYYIIYTAEPQRLPSPMFWYFSQRLKLCISFHKNALGYILVDLFHKIIGSPWVYVFAI
jgi:hypothetical protein